MSTATWVGFAAILVVQNISFTFVSRARNSGSVKRHMVAALFSNGVWFASQLYTVNAITKILSGEEGLGMAVLTGAFYTIFTLLGSFIAHWFALKTEKGKAAVGASQRYKQITHEEWEWMRQQCSLNKTSTNSSQT